MAQVIFHSVLSEVVQIITMPSAFTVLKRALVKVLQSLILTYGLQLQITRDSSDECLKRAYKRLSLKVHPDKGGSSADQQQLNDAYGAWIDGLKSNRSAGRPSTIAVAKRPAANTNTHPTGPRDYRFGSKAVMLTYHNMGETLDTALGMWSRLVSLVHDSKARWQVALWTATLEANENGGYHAHVFIDFKSARDRFVNAFIFEGIRPNAGANDLLGEGFGGNRYGFRLLAQCEVKEMLMEALEGGREGRDGV